MKSAENSILIFGIYMVLIPGLGLIIAPEIILNLFQISFDAASTWSFRLIGLLALIIGVYYVGISKYKLKVLYSWTVVLRYIAAFFMLGLGLAKAVEQTIMLFALVDFAGATWTLLTLMKRKN